VTAIEVGLLTCGSPYSPTPSQPSRGQWPALLVFVPAYSGASVRELHPLPESLISIARIAIDSREVSSCTGNVKYYVTLLGKSSMCRKAGERRRSKARESEYTPLVTRTPHVGA
jgi:hypothetical protein